MAWDYIEIYISRYGLIKMWGKGGGGVGRKARDDGEGRTKKGMRDEKKGNGSAVRIG